MLSSIFIVFVSLSALASAGAAASCVASDRAALLLFKASITKDPQGALSTWKAGTDCCRGWSGVSCNRTTGRVTQLQLDNNALSGSISSSLGSLSELSKLNLASNHLSGPIPGSLGKLSKLKLLDLAYNNGITGPVPESIGGLQSLIRIRLQSNKLSGGIPASFGTLSNLIYAELDHNALQGLVPSSFTKNLTSLALLDLSNNKLTGLPADLSNLKRLGILYLGSNNLMGFDSIRGLTTLPILGELHLDHASLKGAFPDWLASLNLRQSDDFLTSMLDLSFNSMSGSIPEGIQNLTNVDRLVLNNNRFSGAIPASMGKLIGLQYLYINNNQLSGSIPSTMLQLDSLRFFNASNNHLKGQIPQGAPFSSMDPSSFSGNPGLCGHPLPPC